MKTIEQLIDEALVRPPRQRSGKFTPSKFGRCFRAQYWSRFNEPASNPLDARTIRVFEAGKLFEKFVKQTIIGAGNGWIDCGDKPIECEDVIGYADLDNAELNEIADVKSQHSKSFWYMVKCKGNKIREEKKPNWLQVLYYAREKKREYGRLVFISKDDLCIQEYVQPLDDEWRELLATELVTLRHYWINQELPPAEPRCFKKKDGSFGECKYCEWEGHCAELEAKKLLEDKQDE